MRDKDFDGILPGKGRPALDAWPAGQAQALANMREQLRPSVLNIQRLARDLTQMADVHAPGRAMIEHILEPCLTELFEAIVKLYELKIQPIPEDPIPLFQGEIDLTAMARKFSEPDE